MRHAVERTELMADKGSWTRWGIPAGIAAMVTALVIVALIRDPVQLDPDTPEGTVQEYLQAVSEKRWEDAYEVLDPQRFDDCGPADIAAHAPGEPFTASLQSGDGVGVRVTTQELAPEETTTTVPPDEESVVDVTLRFGDSGPFGSGGWTTYEVFQVVSRDGFWWISGDPWPYFGWRC